jgi:hypothetical protein
VALSGRWAAASGLLFVLSGVVIAQAPPPATGEPPPSGQAIPILTPLLPAPPPITRSSAQAAQWLARPKTAAPTDIESQPVPIDVQPGGPDESAASRILGNSCESPSPILSLDPGLQEFFTSPLRYQTGSGTVLQLNGLLRGYWRNDQRIYWSGLENTFGAEGVLCPVVQSYHGEWTFTSAGEFFINQRYGSSILSDPQRDLYRANFQIDQFDIFQLFGQVQYGDLILRIGKSRTPFGNYEGPIFTNSLLDAPFIRTEVIPWAETGLFLHYEPGWLSADVAVVNGEPNLDTNSSKGVSARLGINRPMWTLGASLKAQDGISSEFQKRYNNVYGMDWSVRWRHWIVYGETTYDLYGFRHNFDKSGNPLNLGVRSLYHRDVFTGTDNNPAHGIGYYVAVGYRNKRWLLDGSFGSYYPQHLGIPAHDTPIHRGVFKIAYFVTPNLQIYTVGLAENIRPRDGVLPNDAPIAGIWGLQFSF